MADHDLLTLLVLLLSAALSFLFSGMESGVMALNRLRIRQLMRAGDRRAAVLNGFLENPENFLWTILVGNTMANLAIFSLGSIQLHAWLHGRPFWAIAVFTLGVFVFYVICELLPKTLFQRLPNRLTLALAKPFQFVHLTLTPLVAIVEWLSRGLLRWTGGRTFTGRLFGSREELRFVMQESGSGLTAEEKTMINRVLDLQGVRVRQITVPMPKVISLPSSASVSEAMKLCRERNLTRLPLMDARGKHVAGIFNLERLIYRNDVDPDKKAADYMEPAISIHDHLPAETALHRLQRSGGRMAIVLDRNHHELGIITLQDVLRVIFGEVT